MAKHGRLDVSAVESANVLTYIQMYKKFQMHINELVSFNNLLPQRNEYVKDASIRNIVCNHLIISTVISFSHPRFINKIGHSTYNCTSTTVGSQTADILFATDRPFHTYTILVYKCKFLH